MRLLQEIGDELRAARLTAGLSQRTLGQTCGITHTHVGRIERGRVPNVSFTLLVVLGSTLGLDLSARLYPGGSPSRDAGHVVLITRLRHRLEGALIRWRYEVPIRPGDPRAWDVDLGCRDGDTKLEAETNIRDVQAMERRIALKIADGRADRVILLVADTRSNRATLRDAGDSLRTMFPASQAQVLAALAAGLRPPENGIVVL